MDLQLTDRIALVTGSSRGLGLASARALLAEGCRVAVCARGAERLEEAAESLRREGGADRVLAVQADLSTAAGVATVVGRTVERFGGLNVLVNNVGRAGGGGHRRDGGCGLDRGARRDAVSRHPGVAPVGASSARARRRRHHHDRVDLGPRVRRQDDLQRGQGGGDQSRQVDGPRAGAGQHPREQRGARVHFVSRRVVAPPAAGRPGRDGGVRAGAAPVRALRPGGGSGRGRRVSRLAAGELGEAARA